MSFYSYMVRNYIDEQSPAGDLARDLKLDKNTFPKDGGCKFDMWHWFIREYLDAHGACAACIDVFEDNWRRYVACAKAKWKRN